MTSEDRLMILHLVSVITDIMEEGKDISVIIDKTFKDKLYVTVEMRKEGKTDKTMLWIPGAEHSDRLEDIFTALNEL